MLNHKTMTSMKKTIFTIFIVLIVFLLPNFGLAEQKVTVQNHSFNVITENDNQRHNSKKRVAVYIRNDDCICQYKAMYDQTILGEGQITVKMFPHNIQLGNNKLTISCLPLNDIIVSID